MSSRVFAGLAASFFLAILACAACAKSEPDSHAADVVATPPPPDLGKPNITGTDAAADADGSFKTCASSAVVAAREPLPVDIIWMVDNSSSMAPAVAEVQAGLNTFATFVGSKGLDYKVVMLSLRGSSPNVLTHDR